MFLSQLRTMVFIISIKMLVLCHGFAILHIHVEVLCLHCITKQLKYRAKVNKIVRIKISYTVLNLNKGEIVLYFKVFK